MADYSTHSMVKTKFPVDLPHFAELHYSDADFEEFLARSLKPIPSTKAQSSSPADLTPKESAAPRSTQSTDDEANKQTQTTEPAAETDAPNVTVIAKDGSVFMTSLLAFNEKRPQAPRGDVAEGMTLTANGDPAFATTGSALVDLFQEMEETISAERLAETLEAAWAEDAEATLKLIWNARSIHLGKSSRLVFYRAMGWLYQQHPRSFLENLPWLVRPVIRKKVEKRTEKKDTDAVMVDANDADSDFEMLDEDGGVVGSQQESLPDLSAQSEYDIKYGVSHGYWKDLLNMLALAAIGELRVDSETRRVLKPGIAKHKKGKPEVGPQSDKEVMLLKRHEAVIERLHDSNYKALHLTVARLFAQQLKLDFSRLETGSRQDKKLISLAGKWAPSPKGSHDVNTCIVTSIVDILYPAGTLKQDPENTDRETYLRLARTAYQVDLLSKLRKHLNIVEHEITSGKFNDIVYDRVPSLAMKRYTELFARKDLDHFGGYLARVSTGQAAISGATLLPSTLVQEAMKINRYDRKPLQKMLSDVQDKALNGQWNTLVQRIRDSGTLESSIAVCDVSGSMQSPLLSDKTCPMDSAIGLSLLMAEITQPPFGGAFITFSSAPSIVRVGGPTDTRTFGKKVVSMQRADWGGNTNFTSVFLDLILPTAVEHGLPATEMVKQVFVFSDMHFDAANHDGPAWQTSCQKIKAKFEEAGYEMPKLVFWNLAGSAQVGAGEAAPKPVDAQEQGTALVSGYSQALLKVFLGGGKLEDEEEEEEVIDQTEDGDKVVIQKKEKKDTMTPESIMRKAIAHEAFRMLKVVD